MQPFIEAMHAAELAGLAVYGRAVLGRAVADHAGVISLRMEVTHSSEGLAVVEWELIDAADRAVAGGGL